MAPWYMVRSLVMLAPIRQCCRPSCPRLRRSDGPCFAEHAREFWHPGWANAHINAHTRHRAEHRHTSWYEKNRSHSPLTGSLTAAGNEGTADVLARAAGRCSRVHLAAVGISSSAVGGLMPAGCAGVLKRGKASKTPRTPAVKAPRQTSENINSAITAAPPHSAATCRLAQPVLPLWDISASARTLCLSGCQGCCPSRRHRSAVLRSIMFALMLPCTPANRACCLEIQSHETSETRSRKPHTPQETGYMQFVHMALVPDHHPSRKCPQDSRRPRTTPGTGIKAVHAFPGSTTEAGPCLRQGCCRLDAVLLCPGAHSRK